MIHFNDNYFNGVLTVGSYGCSGSGLLLSLLDGHPNCIGFQDTLLAGYQDWWNSLNEKKGHIVLEDFLDLYQGMFDPSFVHPTRTPPGCGDNLGLFSNFIKNEEFGVKEISVPKEPFVECLSNIVNFDLDENASSFFKKIHFALAYALNKPISSDTLIVHGSTNAHPYRFEFKRSGFRNVWNLLMVRDPVIGHYALIKRWIEDQSTAWSHKPENFMTETLYYMRSFYENIEGWEHCTKAVRLEDLHKYPKKTLTKIIDWVDIPWDDSLYQSTFLGIEWYFSNKAIHRKPFNTEIISRSRYSHLFTPLENHLLSMSVYELYKKWKYDLPNRPLIIDYFLSILGLFKRFKIEKLNRMRFSKIVDARIILIKMLVASLLTFGLSKRSKLYKLLGRDLTNRLLRSAEKRIHPVQLPKSIIELL